MSDTFLGRPVLSVTVYCHVLTSLASCRFPTCTLRCGGNSGFFSLAILNCGPLGRVISNSLIFTAQKWTWFSLNNHTFSLIVPRIRCASTTSLLDTVINGCVMDPTNPFLENSMHGEDAGRPPLCPSSDAVCSQSESELLYSHQCNHFRTAPRISPAIQVTIGLGQGGRAPSEASSWTNHYLHRNVKVDKSSHDYCGNLVINTVIR